MIFSPPHGFARTRNSEGQARLLAVIPYLLNISYGHELGPLFFLFLAYSGLVYAAGREKKTKKRHTEHERVQFWVPLNTRGGLTRKLIFRLKNPSLRLDIADSRALATQRDKRLKLNIRYGHELINCEMSVCF